MFKNEKLRWMMGWPLGPKINKLHLSTLLYNDAFASRGTSVLYGHFGMPMFKERNAPTSSREQSFLKKKKKNLSKHEIELQVVGILVALIQIQSITSIKHCKLAQYISRNAII